VPGGTRRGPKGQLGQAAAKKKANEVGGFKRIFEF
jgi:hypothetical protein